MKRQGQCMYLIYMYMYLIYNACRYDAHIKRTKPIKKQTWDCGDKHICLFYLYYFLFAHRPYIYDCKFNFK